MEQPKIKAQLEEIKNLHSYGIYRPYLSQETIARGENLEEILPKLVDLRNQIEEYKKHLAEQRSAVYAEIVVFLSSKGLPAWEYTGRRSDKRTAKYLNEINVKLSENYRYNDYSELTEITLMEKYIKLAIANKQRAEKEKAIKEDEGQKYLAILKTASEYLTPEEIATAKLLGATYEQLDSLLKERYKKSCEGELIGISCCSECEEYTMGEHRCSCGNRRISAAAESYYFNGTYSLHIETEAY
jgi:hypothetical protein